MPDIDEVVRLPLAALTFDSRLQLRAAGTDDDLVAEYVEAMGDGATFPPLAAKYDGATYWVYRGFHRGEAAQRLRLTDLPVVVEAGTFDDAVMAACGENAEHGKRRQRGDLTRAILALLPVIARREDFPEAWSQRRIAEVCHCSESMVGHVLVDHAENPFYSVPISSLRGATPRAVGVRAAAEKRRAQAEAEQRRQHEAQREAERAAMAASIRAEVAAAVQADVAASFRERERTLGEEIARARDEARQSTQALANLRGELEQMRELERRRREAEAAEMADAAEMAERMIDENPALVRSRWKAALSQAILMVNRHWLVLNVETFASVAEADERRRMIDFLGKLRASVERAEAALGVRVMARKGDRSG